MLLTTKLFVPRKSRQLIARPHLVEKLNAGLNSRVTLICAPAGFGKTTLVSEWTAQTDQSVAWLSLDDDDNDTVRFLTYLVAALRTVHNQIGETTLAALDFPQSTPIKPLLTLLLNDLGLLAEGFVAVLDDYHLITARPIHEALTFLITGCGCGCVKVISAPPSAGPRTAIRWGM